MASIINAATSGGLVTTADTSGILQLQTAGTTAVTVDASQRVGIGIAPSAWSVYKPLQLIGGSMGGYDSSYLELFQNSYYDGTSNKYVVSNYASRYLQNSGTHVWYTAPSGTAGNTVTFTQALTLNNNGALALQGASTSATGVGITFPATQSASSDANTLDDYEEGSWTPTLTASTTAPSSVSYADQTGRYTKVGRVVTVTMFLQINNRSGGSGNTRIAGLPFTSQNVGAAVIGQIYLGLVNWGASRTSLYCSVAQNDTYINIGSLGTNLDPGAIAITEFNNTDDYVGITITYFV